MNPRDRDGGVLQYCRLMIPTTEQPATARRTQRRRNVIIGATAAAIAVGAAVIVIATTSGSGSRSGTLVGTCDIGPGAQCPGANLTGANLAGANLAGVDVNSSGIIGTPSALPAGWVLVGGVLRQG